MYRVTRTFNSPPISYLKRNEVGGLGKARPPGSYKEDGGV